jgi:acyl-CoA hydrolase
MRSNWSGLVAYLLAVALVAASSFVGPGTPARSAFSHSVQTKHTTSFVVFPADTNANPPMAFGGKLMAEMDRCAGITVRRFLYSSTVVHDAVTVAVKDLQFHKGAAVKDLLFVSGEVVEAGGKSVTVTVIVERETADLKREKLLSGTFVFCAFDLEAKKAVAHGVALPP